MFPVELLLVPLVMYCIFKFMEATMTSPAYKEYRDRRNGKGGP